MKDKKLIYFAPFVVMVVVALVLIFSTKSKNRGEVLYENRCANCHMEQGVGLQSLIPPLANVDYLNKYRDKLACIVKKGMDGKVIVNGVEYEQQMPANEEFTDTDIANVLNYVLTNWGNEEKPLSLQEVQKQLEGCP
ncbi:c-type cytochrome [Chondrinema litorale]|uniref:c-type cytochrome n=1 Tax=Chondrinema litorale TaxID=2994555 RepID=UPI002543C40A|nr:cytochrome c [Chondrinema litorale]UZR98718.1 cytochrome c [Chondrinema litorale]